MNKIANVQFAYSPKNDDELELKVGDEIEVIGFEEEGWWRGRLRGKTGVFPENFVQLVESELPNTANQQNANKLNSIFGSRVNTKNSISSNSLNTINNNSNVNISSIKNSTSNNNLIMNNTHLQPHQHEGDSSSEFPYVSDSINSTGSLTGERRPKPLKGIGYGDIFAAGAKTKPLPADPPIARPNFAKPSDRPSANSLSNTFQKSIPKKPPPPAPIDNGSTNGSSSDQAPALPPKPINQFNSFVHQRPTTLSKTQTARVKYAYKPANDDELELEVDDIINVLDMNIEDPGWWRGELKGRVGVFPDNFVELIDGTIQNQDHINQADLSSSTSNSSHSNAVSNNILQQQQIQPPITAEALGGCVLRPVFSGTPKGFSKELESNLEKHVSPASILSTKRLNSKPLQQTGNLSNETNSIPEFETEAAIAASVPQSPLNISDSSEKQNGSCNETMESSPGKLNHITANRAKGPSRRPPSNLLVKRNQLNETANNCESTDSRDELPSASLPVFNYTAPVQSQSKHNYLASLPIEQSQKNASPVLAKCQFPAAGAHTSPPPIILRNELQSNNQSISSGSRPETPKISQRPTNQTSSVPPETKIKPNPDSCPTTPPWMVELRKTNAEKKRDPLPAPINNVADPIITTSANVPSTTTTMSNISTQANANSAISLTTPNRIATANSTATIHTCPNPINGNLAVEQDDTQKKASNDLVSVVDELKNEVKRLRGECETISKLKEELEMMRIELKACQSATESQRMFIKDLVNNLADEKKKIAAMQVEIDRNLK